jgi:hypothetical protein
VYELRALSPGLPPAALPPSPPPPKAATTPSAACASPSKTLLAQDTLPDSFVLRGDAASGAPTSGRHGLGSVTLTAARPQSAGTVEFSRTISPLGDCRSECAAQPRMMLVTVYVWLGSGSGSGMPGEGLVISLVDASRQTPGATRYIPGCGTRAALPQHALSVVLDTSDSDPACDEPGTGARIVSTLGAAAADGTAPPLVLCSTLEMSTVTLRRNNWTAVQFMVDDSNKNRYSGYTSGGEDRRDTDVVTSAQQQAAAVLWAPVHVYVGGDELLDTRGALMAAHASQLRATNSSLSDAFYIVVSARTGETSSDVHAVSAVHVECRHLGVFHRDTGEESVDLTWIENWSSLRQPLTPVKPPERSRSPPPWAQSETPPAAMTSLTHVDAALVGFMPAFCVTAALLCAAAARMHRHARAAQMRRRDERDASWRKQELLPLAVCVDASADAHAEEDVEAEREAPTSPAAPVPSVHVCLSCRHVDWRLADALHDKLRLAGLDTLFRRDDAHAPRSGSSCCAEEPPQAAPPADEPAAELVRAVRSAPVFAPIISLHSLARMAAAAGADAGADVPLAECLAALCCRDADMARRVRLVHPLLAPAALTPSVCGSMPRMYWCSLAEDAAYAAALAALPNEVPVATVALVDASFRAALGRPLPARFASLTVRQILLGRKGGSGGGGADDDDDVVHGVLEGQPFALACAEVRVIVAVAWRASAMAAQALPD